MVVQLLSSGADRGLRRYRVSFDSRLCPSDLVHHLVSLIKARNIRLLLELLLLLLIKVLQPVFLLQLIHLFLTIGIHYLEFEKHLLDLQLAKIERFSINNVSDEGQLLD